MIENRRELWVLRDVDERGFVSASHAFWVDALIERNLIACSGESHEVELFLTESGAAELDWWNDNPADERRLESDDYVTRIYICGNCRQPR